ncbi:alpha-ketoglutarate-dependent dioxygenase alkB like 3 [Fusarium beomiforme]|uniref:Alpha-ketoglutarate-dependent dioxygenase alkB like 3 n=1 Tax=Fusarium beomiforme TaxID=44412 RepID=A0A9P5APS8_9HYPO|nr:alpha-ketoglutarate-dependent dioxygenase alkB like 3 [Fusarium beomiforme]
MFPFDHAALPQITTRKALIGVDFQHDFISKDGALPVHEPEDFVDQTIKLAQAFRDVGDVVWVQSQFSEARPAPEEQIVITDNAPKTSRASKRGRPNIPVQPIVIDGPPDEEAFLSHENPVCVKADTPGCRIASAIEESLPKTDTRLTKSHYSAFQSTHLLRLLRAKMVMELFICGSLTNIGVYATALDAAGHGMAITIVDDCCGYRSEARKIAAIASLIELTGCEIASYAEVMEVIQPKSRPTKPQGSRKPPASSKDLEQSPSAKPNSSKDMAREKSTTPDFVKDMTSLRLASDSPSPAPSTQPTQPQQKAPSTSAAENRDSDVEPKSNAKEPNGVSQVRATEAPNDKNESNTARHSPIKAAVTDVIEVETAVEIALASSRNTSKDKGKDKEKNINTDPPKSATQDNDQVIEPSSPAEIAKRDEQTIQTPPAQTTNKHEEQTMEAQPDKKKYVPEINKPTGMDDGHRQQEGLCEGDTYIIENLLPESLLEGIFDQLREEVQWQRMSHQGGQVPRLVAVQGEIGLDGNIPVYRHPSDESPPLLPFSPAVLAIKAETEKKLGHSLNHVLIQYYRDGNDYISEHSDKTLDIVKGSYIANVSLGAERTMTFRTKRRDKDPSQEETASPTASKRMIQRAKLPHNSLCRLGLQSNMKWLHAIRQDKRSEKEKSTAELAYEGGRISLTFRQIGTFLNREETLIWGQGAKAKAPEDAHAVINGQSTEAIEMLKAFGTENHSSEFDWEAHYGKGFDVLHMSNAPRFFACNDTTVNMRIALMLAEYGVNYAKGSITTGSELPNSENLAVKFVDKDASTVQGDLAVMSYIDARYGLGRPGSTLQAPKDLATRLTRFQRAMSLLDLWRSLSKENNGGKRDVTSLKQELEVWDGFLAEDDGHFIAGVELSLPDFAFWPILHIIVEETGPETLHSHKKLLEYYGEIGERASVKKVLGKKP